MTETLKKLDNERVEVTTSRDSDVLVVDKHDIVIVSNDVGTEAVRDVENANFHELKDSDHPIRALSNLRVRTGLGDSGYLLMTS